MMGKNPTRKQKILLKSLRLNPADWLICRDSQKELILKSRHTSAVKRIPKEII